VAIKHDFSVHIRVRQYIEHTVYLPESLYEFISMSETKLTVIGVCGLNGDPVLSRVMWASNDETDPVLIHIQTNMATIVSGTRGTTVSVCRNRVQVRFYT